MRMPDGIKVVWWKCDHAAPSSNFKAATMHSSCSCVGSGSGCVGSCVGVVDVETVVVGGGGDRDRGGGGGVGR